MGGNGCGAETAQDHFLNRFGIGHNIGNGINRDDGSPLSRKAINPCADRRKGDSFKAVLYQYIQCVAVAAFEQAVFVIIAAMPNRSDGVNDILRR